MKRSRCEGLASPVDLLLSVMMSIPIGYVAYIDEAGDDGIRTVAPLDARGASEWFVLGAFVVPIHEDRGGWGNPHRAISGISA